MPPYITLAIPTAFPTETLQKVHKHVAFVTAHSVLLRFALPPFGPTMSVAECVPPGRRTFFATPNVPTYFFGPDTRVLKNGEDLRRDLYTIRRNYPPLRLPFPVGDLHTRKAFALLLGDISNPIPSDYVLSPTNPPLHPHETFYSLIISTANALRIPILCPS